MRKRNSLSIIILLILMLVIALAFFVQHRIAPFTDSLAETQAQYMANKITYDSVLKVLDEYEKNGKELYFLEKDNVGNIKAERANIIEMNKFKADLYLELNEAFAKTPDDYVRVSIGSISGIDLLANLGFKLPVRISFTGKVVMEFKDDFVSVGINQSKHNAYLHIVSEVSVVFIGRNKTSKIVQDVPLTDTIIHGDVPAFYSN